MKNPPNIQLSEAEIIKWRNIIEYIRTKNHMNKVSRSMKKRQRELNVREKNNSYLMLNLNIIKDEKMTTIICPHCGKNLTTKDFKSTTDFRHIQQQIIERHIKRDCNSKEVVHLTRKLDFPVVETIEDYKKLIKKEEKK